MDRRRHLIEQGGIWYAASGDCVVAGGDWEGLGRSRIEGSLWRNLREDQWSSLGSDGAWDN